MTGEDMRTCGREPREDMWTCGRELCEDGSMCGRGLCEDVRTGHLDMNFVRTGGREEETSRGRELQGLDIVAGVNFKGETLTGA